MPACRHISICSANACGHRHDRNNAARPRQSADQSARFQPVHSRHPHIHQDDIEILGCGIFNRGGAVVDADHLVSTMRRKPLAMARFKGSSSTTRTRRCGGLWQTSWRSGLARYRNSAVHRQFQPEYTAAARVIGMADPSAHELHEPCRNG